MSYDPCWPRFVALFNAFDLSIHHMILINEFSHIAFCILQVLLGKDKAGKIASYNFSRILVTCKFWEDQCKAELVRKNGSDMFV
jgi:hypothetical protein